MLVNDAHDYVTKGWSVIPLRTNSKLALIKWKRFQSKKPVHIDIQSWWGKYSLANIGLICGRISGYAVLDVDPRNGGEVPEGLPKTYTVSTPSGGVHLYFKLPLTDEVIRSGIFAPGVDFVAEGEYVVAPPSVVDDKNYTIINDIPAVELPPTLRATTPSKLGKNNELNTVENGVRNSTLISIAGSMRRQGLWYAPINAALQIINQEKCIPPLNSIEVEQIAKSIIRYNSIFGDDLPLIVVNNRQDREIIEDLLQAFLQSNTTPWLFQRDGYLVRLINTPDGGLSVDSLNQYSVAVYATQNANWVRRGTKGVQDVSPPPHILRSALSVRDARFPILKSIAEIPIFDVNNKLCLDKKYLKLSNIYCAPNVKIDKDEVQEMTLTQAKNLINKDMLFDFPFVNSSSRANFMSALILPFISPLISGPTPLHVIEAPMAGTGKSLLMNCISYIVTGRPAEVITGARDEDEWRKRITAVLMKAPTIVCFDNLEGVLNNQHLAAALTSLHWSDRELGQSRVLDIPINCTWIASGNNLSMDSQIARRSIMIRLDTGRPKPWERPQNSFKHKDLLKWVKQNRKQLVMALLTIIGYGLSKPIPDNLPTLGSFEDYVEVMGRILHNTGFEGFLTNQREVYQDTVYEDEEWVEFIHHWHEEFADRMVQTKVLWELADNNDLLPSVRGFGNDRSQMSKLGWAISKMRDRVFQTDEVTRYRITLAKTTGGYRKLHRLVKLV